MHSKFENLKANANVVWFAAVLIGAFVLNAVRVGFKRSTWVSTYAGERAQAVQEIELLDNTISGLRPSLATMPHRYAQFKLALALDNASELEDALKARIIVLDAYHRNRCEPEVGAAMQDIPGIVANVLAQLKQAARYAGNGCPGQDPAITLSAWFTESWSDDGCFKKVYIWEDDSAFPASVLSPAENRLAERQVAGRSNAVAPPREAHAKPVLTLVHGGLSRSDGKQ